MNNPLSLAFFSTLEVSFSYPASMPTPADQAAFLIGVDEAGRGALAGEVCVGAVWPPLGGFSVPMKDSKTLSAKQRTKLACLIRKQAWAWSLVWVSAASVDRLNVLQATLEGMHQAISALSDHPWVHNQLQQGHWQRPARCQAWIDGPHAPKGLIPGVDFRPQVKADRDIEAVAAASILAKTARDERMGLWQARYPGYGFEIHKGYPTALHQEALVSLGPCPIHRRSYGPVQKAYERQTLKLDSPNRGAWPPG